MTISKDKPPTDNKSDALLLALIAKGDKPAFSQLMEQYLSSVILFVMRYCPQKSDAEDIAQETFLRLWSKAPVWQDQGFSVKAWIFKVAYNLSIDHLRKNKHDAKSVSEDENIVDQQAFIEQLMIAKSDLSLQSLALDQLPERQCTAIMLCTVKGLSNSEAARVMDVSINALESLLARGRRNLKKLYLQATEGQLNYERKNIHHIR